MNGLLQGLEAEIHLSPVMDAADHGRHPMRR